jgi:hypothetical protein
VIRPPVATFAMLGIATVGAFFLTQHLKVTTPFINGLPAPVPSTINPVSGGTCRVRDPKGKLVPVSFKEMRVSFYLQNHADDVSVEIVDQGKVVRTLPGSGRYMSTFKRRQFVWDGRESNGRYAPDGAYDIKVSLEQQDRSLLIRKTSGAVEPVIVQVHPPPLLVTAVAPRVVSVSSHPSVTIHYTGNQGLRPQILILRIAGSRTPRVVKSYAATTRTGTSEWNGTRAGGLPAAPGTYLVGLRLWPDSTCNRVQSALTPAAAPQAVVTVR